jgi:magnesium chelatase family protein
MTVTMAHGAVSVGMMGQLVEVQAHVCAGLPGMTIVGLPDTSISESRDRVRSAVSSCGYAWPAGRITVGLSPAFEHKRGSGLDLAVAMAVLAASEEIAAGRVARGVFLGELGLDGSVRPIPGAVALALGIARGAPGACVYASPTTAEQVARVPGIRAVSVDSLAEAVDVVSGVRPAVPATVAVDTAIAAGPVPELSEVLGHRRACRSLEVAAAGGHHLLLEGPPGVGKTMLARRLPGLLPPLVDEQALEVAAIRDAADGHVESITRVPPFRAPHHSTTHIAMVGGSVRGAVRPGQISLAHHGVLFLDEAPEFSRVTLESLRQPLEEGVISIARAAMTERLPARFQLVLAANPCPCGQAGQRINTCRCSPAAVHRYRTRLSGPLLDRLDLRIAVGPPVGRMPADATAVVRDRVLAARERALARLGAVGESINCRIPGAVLRRQFAADDGATAVLERLYAQQEMSMRSLDRVLRVAWTLADLAGVEVPGVDEVSEAVALRGGEAQDR